METDLFTARKILEQESCTCVLCRGDAVYRSSDRGIAPLMKLLQNKTNVMGFAAADQVVGKAAAFLYCLLKVSCIYAPVVSRGALEVLQAHGIAVSYCEVPDRILNRSRDGFCPMESAVETADTPREALEAICKALKKA